MADGDQRIEVLEDEMKVLKGEVSRTLVDLRALLMREESPLMSGGLVNRIVAPSDGGVGVTTKITLAPVVEAPATVAVVAPPGVPDVEPAALAGLPDLGTTATPEPPGSPSGGIIPSLEGQGVSPLSNAAPPASAPSAGDFNLPGAPSTGDSTLPNANALPGPGPDADLADEERIRKRRERLLEEESLEEGERALRSRKRESDQAEEATEQETRDRRKKRAQEDVEESKPGVGPASDPAKDAEDVERLRQRKAHLEEEESVEVAERALRKRKREGDQEEEAAEQETRGRRKKRTREDALELEIGTAPGSDSDPVAELKKAQLKDAEDDKRRRERKERLREEQASDDAERARRDRRKENERSEEQDEEDSRKRRQKRSQEEDEELENRSRKRKREQLEEEADQERRDRRMKQERAEEEADQERRDRRKDQEPEYGETPEHRDPNTLAWQETNDQLESQYGSESQDEIDHFRRVGRRGRGLEQEMENFSESHMSESDWDPGMSSNHESGPLDEVPEDQRSSMGPDAARTGLDVGEDEEYGSEDEQADLVTGAGQVQDDLVTGAGQDQDEEGDQAQNQDYELEFSPESARVDGIGDGPAASGGDDYSDDWDDSEEPSPPQLDPLDDYDPYENQEEPKINGNNGPRRPKGPEAGRRTYEDDNYQESDYQDNYDDGRNQEHRSRPQNPTRAQRMPRPSPGGPMGRRPPTGNYGYAPQKGNGRWEQPPSGPDRWPGPQEWAPEPPPMDLNLVSNLVRWASMAKHRVGEKRLSDIIELYVASRNAPPGLSKVLANIASIVDDQAPESGQTAQETMDLIAHLHGILTASLPVPAVPLFDGPINFGAGNRAYGGNGPTRDGGKGDW